MTMPADWQEVTIAAGQSESEEIAISYDEISIPPGKLTKADGSKFQGRDRPRYDVEQTDAGCKIVLQGPATEDLVFRVKSETL
jgi:hypothetical protein